MSASIRPTAPTRSSSTWSGTAFTDNAIGSRPSRPTGRSTTWVRWLAAVARPVGDLGEHGEGEPVDVDDVHAPGRRVEQDHAVVGVHDHHAVVERLDDERGQRLGRAEDGPRTRRHEGGRAFTCGGAQQDGRQHREDHRCRAQHDRQCDHGIQGTVASPIPR